jgi:hypothetical protein
MNIDIRGAGSAKRDTREGALEVVARFEGMTPTVLAFFVSPGHDGLLLSRILSDRFPKARIVGCTTAGEFSQQASTVGGMSCLALGAGKVRRAASALADFSRAESVEGALRTACDELARTLGVDLRSLDPTKWAGVVLVDGLHMKEEAVNEALGNIAPQLSFVGGSAGDDLAFRETKVFSDGAASSDGAALLLFEAAVPFAIGKTCSFVPSRHVFRVTKADRRNRTIEELDGRPVLEAYAEAVGRSPDRLDSSVFMSHPIGVMIDDRPWIRSPQQALPDGGLKFYCEVLEGMEVHVMEPTDMVEDSRRSLDEIRAELGGAIAGGLAFNCILRRLELEAEKKMDDWLGSFGGVELAGFHTYGETWLGHVNQTLTGLWFR